MVVKSERGRRRYIVFSAPESATRADVEAVVEAISPRPPMLKTITCSKGLAVVRVGPEGRDALCDAMGGHGYTSLMTSGTLRTIRDRYPDTRVPQKRKRRGRTAAPQRLYTAPSLQSRKKYRSGKNATRTDGL